MIQTFYYTNAIYFVILSSMAISFFYLDAVSLTMFALVGFLGFVVLRYSRHYMAGEPGRVRFFTWLALTIASVLLMVVSGNLMVFFAAWLATSLCLHRLLLFYPDRRAAVVAARKKFVISRVGDLCLLSAILVIGQAYGTWNFGALFALAASGFVVPDWTTHTIALLLVSGALLKSAQFPFHTWLPETMETPTPVSALMHAGIINAGGFLVIRLSPLIAPSHAALYVLAIVGVITALFASLVLLTQTSVKKSLAYSTIAQMGFMMMQCGLGAFSLALLHIVAHSLYKAHAFLVSGSVVGLARLSWVPKGTGRPHPVLLALLLAGVAVGTFFAAPFFGVRNQPGVVALGTILLFGVVQLLWSTCARPLRFKALARAVGISLGVCAAYFLLHSVAESLYGSVVPVDAGQNPLLAVALLILFGAAMIFQAMLPDRRNDPLWRRLYVHASNGFYLGTIANVFIERLWPTAPAARKQQGAPTPTANPVRAAEEEAFDSAIAAACKRVPPMWPLRHFVAVNPFWGLVEKPFGQAVARMRKTSHSRLHMDADYYRKAWESGRIGEADLQAANAAVANGRHSLESLTAAWNARPVEMDDRILTFAEFVDAREGTFFADAIAEDLAKWCAAIFDQGQAAWTPSGASIPLFQKWKSLAAWDRNPEMRGLAGFRALVRQLPDDPEACIAQALSALGVPAQSAEQLLHRQFLSLSGWASHVSQLVWTDSMAGKSNPALRELLAIRLACDWALAIQYPTATESAEWMANVGQCALVEEPSSDTWSIWQAAVEISVQREFVEALGRTSAPESSPGQRPATQAVFCIDVRSERMRLALESVSSTTETIGFAGFFGFPLRHVALGQDEGSALCPVLLNPTLTVRETLSEPREREALMTLRNARRTATSAWRGFKVSAVSSFSFVEACGLGFVVKLIRDSFGWPAVQSAPELDGLSTCEQKRLVRHVACCGNDSLEALADTAANALRKMGITRGFARIVLVCGHGSTTINNPYGSALDCGACGGHAGHTNARVAAQVFNDPEIRTLLVQRGIEIPADTWFVASLHDTTTDEVALLDSEAIPSSHRNSIEVLQQELSRASALVRRQRATSLGLDPDGVGLDALVSQRSRDWAQVRPEWGLAGNAAFIAAPRTRTAGLPLDGRAFLHNYDAASDSDGSVLELILCAPMVVANWINMQYYASTIDNERFGSGTKVTHNVVGTLGVVQGNGGDLRVGLPWQSVHDGSRFMHDPVRLNVFIEAAPDAMDAILAKHEVVRQLVENEWLHLFAMEPGNPTIRQRKSHGTWTECVAPEHTHSATMGPIQRTG